MQAEYTPTARELEMERTSDNTSRWRKVKNAFGVTQTLREGVQSNANPESNRHTPRANQPITVKPSDSIPDTIVPHRLQHHNYETQQGNGGSSHQQNPYSQPSYPPSNTYWGQNTYQSQGPPAGIDPSSQTQSHYSNQHNQNTQYSQSYPSQQQHYNQNQHGYQSPNVTNQAEHAEHAGYDQPAEIGRSIYDQAVNATYARGPEIESQRPSYGPPAQQPSDQRSHGGSHKSEGDYASHIGPHSQSVSAASPPHEYFPPQSEYSAPSNDPQMYRLWRSQTGMVTPSQDAVPLPVRRAQTDHSAHSDGDYQTAHVQGPVQPQQPYEQQQGYSHRAGSSYNSQYNQYQRNSTSGYR